MSEKYLSLGHSRNCGNRQEELAVNQETQGNATPHRSGESRTKRELKLTSMNVRLTFPLILPLGLSEAMRKCLRARISMQSTFPLPTGPRKEWAIKAAEAGKHLMCEKPCGVDAAEVEEIISACDKAGVQFMDGVMFMHSDRLAKIRESLDDGETIGKLRRIATQFSFWAPEDFLTGKHSDA